MAGTEDLDLREIARGVETAMSELIAAASLARGEIVVLGGSTSEIRGRRIGSHTSREVGDAVLAAILPRIVEGGLFLAVQACEHLNRALVVERACQRAYGFDVVSVYPWEHAGGGFATAAMALFGDPVVVEDIGARGAAGLDIGDAFIGMHVRPVGVPVRGSLTSIGAAHLSMVRTRPKLIGGRRARYTKDEASEG